MMKVLIAGATGLIGNLLLEYLIADNNFSEVVLLVRNKIDHKSKKSSQIVFDFDREDLYAELGSFDVVFCCLGTTIKKAGSTKNFAQVDFQYPYFMAKHIAVRQFHLISSMGANQKSSFFYPKTKGRIEEKLKTLDLESLHIYRPSQLVGNRKEFRLIEQVSEPIMRLLNPLLPKDYRLIKAKTVAKAMINNALNREKGIFVHRSGQIKEIKK